MLALVGPVPLVVLSRLLLVLVLLPFVGALAALWLSRKEGRSKTALAWAGRLPGWVALAVSLLTLSELGALPAAYKQVFGGAIGLVRVGSFDLSLGLSLDGLSGPALAVAAGLYLAAQTWTTRDAPKALVVASLNVLGGASFFALLADGTFALALGAALEAVAIVLVVAALDPSQSPFRKLAPALAIGQSLLVLAMGLAFWATAGAFTTAGYVPDGRARFVSIDGGKTSVLPRGVAIDDDDDDGPRRPAARGSQASLTMLAAPGARLFLDGGTTPFATTPFVRRAIPSGGHSAHLVLGGATDELELSPFQALAGAETTLTVIAPTTTFRDLAALVRSRDGDGPLGVGPRLSANARGGSPFVWITVLAALAALFRVGAACSATAAPGVLAALALLPTTTAVYTLARLATTLAGSETAIVLVVLGAAGALAAGTASFRARDRATIIALATAAHAGVSVAAIGAGAPLVGVLHMVSASAAGALALWGVQALADGPAARGPSLVRLGAACLGVLPPGLGASWTALEALRRSASAAGQLLVAVALVGAVVGAAAVFRVASGLESTAPAPPPADAPTTTTKTKTKKNKRADAEPPKEDATPTPVSLWLAFALAPVALVLGLLSSTVLFEGALARLARTATPQAPALVEIGAMPFVLAVAVLLVAAFAWTRAKAPREAGDEPARGEGVLSSLEAALLALGRRANALDDAVARAVPSPGGASEDGR